MSLSILEVLQNAEMNLGNGGLGMMLAKQQLHNGIVLLEKGYAVDADFHTVMGDHVSVEQVPDKN